LVWFCLSVYRHAVFGSSLFDLGLFDQIVWNTAHGHAFRCSVHRLHFLGDHFGPALLVVTPLYWLVSSPVALLAVNALCVGAAAWPLFLAAKARGLTREASSVLLLAFLAYPSCTSIAVYDFHPDLLALPWLMAALYFESTSRYRAMVVAALLAMSCKEEYAVFVAALGVFVAVGRKDVAIRRFGLALSAFALLYLWVVIKFVMPRYNAQGMEQLSRYEYLGHGLGGIAINLFRRPWVFFQQITPVKLVHFVLTFAVLGFVPLRRPRHLLIALPTWGYSLLSTHENQAFMHYQNMVPVLPPLFFATLEALAPDAASEPALQRRRRVLSALAPFNVALALIVQWWMWGRHPQPSREAVQAVARQLPPDASLSTTNALGPHFAQRAMLTKFPSLRPLGATEPVEFVLLPLMREGWRFSTKGPQEMVEAVRTLPSLGYSLISVHDGVVLYSRVTKPSPEEREALLVQEKALLDSLH
jgi:hypothetical protein